MFPNPLNLRSAWRTLHAASAPVATMVKASPKLKAETKVNPIATCLSCKQINKTLKAAGHGIRPPVRPNRRICGVVTFCPAKRWAISMACALSCASWYSLSSPAILGREPSLNSIVAVWSWFPLVNVKRASKLWGSGTSVVESKTFPFFLKAISSITLHATKPKAASPICSRQKRIWKN